MALAHGEAAREIAPEATRPSALTAAVATAPTLLLSLQRTAGNAAVSRWVLARQPAPAGTAGATAVAKVGRVGGTRPTITETSKAFEDCNAAVAWVNSGTYIGEAEPIYSRPPASRGSRSWPTGRLRPRPISRGTSTRRRGRR